MESSIGGMMELGLNLDFISGLVRRKKSIRAGDKAWKILSSNLSQPGDSCWLLWASSSFLLQIIGYSIPPVRSMAAWHLYARSLDSAAEPGHASS